MICSSVKRFFISDSFRHSRTLHSCVATHGGRSRGLKGDQARRLKELERENQRLKRIVADLSVEKAILKDAAEGNF
jgi:hypothetical protein